LVITQKPLIISKICTTKTGHHDIGGILLKVALKHQKSKIKIKQIEYLIFDPYKNIQL
jgi:hypothetical protein